MAVMTYKGMSAKAKASLDHCFFVVNNGTENKS